MSDTNDKDDRSRRVASGFPNPDDVPGPTERLRELHGDTATEPKPPKYGRASASTAGSDDYITLDDMEHGSGAGGATDRVASFAQRVAEETATRLRADFDISGFSATNQIILTALKRYGMMIADNGSAWYISGAPDSRWDDDDLHNLGQVTGADFEVVNVSPLMVNENSGQAHRESALPDLAAR